MKLPRILIGAGASGTGKTMITCALLKALKDRNEKPGAFKCGPDYIDPLFHQEVLGIPSGNVDSFFSDRNTMKALFGEKAGKNRISVIEGVMGYYDGLGGITDRASTYEIASAVEAPVILVVPCKGMSLSIIAYIKGFLEYKRNSRIKGVILNQISRSLYPGIKKEIEGQLGLKVFGFLPPLPHLAVESRHLGLVVPNEVENIHGKLNELGRTAGKTLDLEGILELADQAPELEWEPLNYPKLDKEIIIGAAKDEAFCFLYEDNITALEKMGAKIRYFSPLHDKRLPEGISGLILPGGYPEFYAGELSQNRPMLQDIKAKIDAGMPCQAECGGFLYLHEEMQDMKGIYHKMAGIIPGKAWKTNELGRFGYIDLLPSGGTVYGEDIFSLKGHEFHYFESGSCGNGFLARKPDGKREWECIHQEASLTAGFPHIYFHSDLKFPLGFLKTCEKSGAEK